MREEEIKDKLEELKLDSEKKAEILSDILEYNKSKSVEVFTEGDENMTMNEISPKNKKASVKKIVTFVLSSAAMLALVAGLVTLGQNNSNKESAGGQGINNSEDIITTSIAENDIHLPNDNNNDDGVYYFEYEHYGIGISLQYNLKYFNKKIAVDESLDNMIAVKSKTENNNSVWLHIKLIEESKDEFIFNLRAQSAYKFQEEDVFIGINNIPAKKFVNIENENGTGKRIINYVFENKDSTKENNVYLMYIVDYCNSANTSDYDKYWEEMISSIRFLDGNESDDTEKETVGIVEPDNKPDDETNNKPDDVTNNKPDDVTNNNSDDEPDDGLSDTILEGIVKVTYSEETDKFLFFLSKYGSEAETAPIGYDGVDLLASVDAKKVYDSNNNLITDIDYILSINKDSNLMAKVTYNGLIMETYPAQVNAYTITIVEK